MGSVYMWDGGKQEAGCEPPQLHGSRLSTRRQAPAQHPCTWARSLARSGAPSEECDAPLPYPDPSPGRLAFLLAAPGPPPSPRSTSGNRH